MRVRDVMTTAVVTARPDTTFDELVDLMLRYRVSGLPVIDDDRRPIGIATESDLVAKEAFHERATPRPASPVVFPAENTWVVKARGTCAAELMSSPVRTVRPDDLLRLAAARWS